MKHPDSHVCKKRYIFKKKIKNRVRPLLGELHADSDGQFLSYLYFTEVFTFFRCFTLPLHYILEENIVLFTPSYVYFGDHRLHQSQSSALLSVFILMNRILKIWLK